MVEPRMYSAFLLTSILLISLSVQIIYALPTDWDVQLTASISNYTDDSIFGCMSGATDGFDAAYDSLDPPAAPIGIVSYFYYPINPTSPINFQKLSISKIDHSSSQKIWTFIVKQNVADGTLTINWILADILTIPEAYSVTLQGPSSEVVNMREITTHSFTSNIDIDYTFAIILEEIPPEMYYLSVNTVGNGVVTVNGSSPYDTGNVLMMTAYPEAGWTFEGWSGDLTGTANPDTILMDSNKTVTCTFTENIPLIETCDASGIKKDTFSVEMDVYINGTSFEKDTVYSLYLVEDQAIWSDGIAIPTRVSGTATTVTSDAGGNIPPNLAWAGSLNPGKYDVVVDVNNNGIYDAGVDALDDSDIEVTAGLFVIPEIALGAIYAMICMIFACIARARYFGYKSRKNK